MVVQGCPFRGKCEKYERTNSGWKGRYCDNPSGCERCPDRPKNYGDRQLREEANNFEQGQGIGALIVLGLIIFGALKLFGVL